MPSPELNLRPPAWGPHVVTIWPSFSDFFWVWKILISSASVQGRGRIFGNKKKAKAKLGTQR